MRKEDYEYLKKLPYLGIKLNLLEVYKYWWVDGYTIIKVARILNRNDEFKADDKESYGTDIIDYFEAPHKWESDIKKLIKEYEEDSNPKSEDEE